MAWQLINKSFTANVIKKSGINYLTDTKFSAVFNFKREAAEYVGSVVIEINDKNNNSILEDGDITIEFKQGLSKDYYSVQYNKEGIYLKHDEINSWEREDRITIKFKNELSFQDIKDINIRLIRNNGEEALKIKLNDVPYNAIDFIYGTPKSSKLVAIENEFCSEEYFRNQLKFTYSPPSGGFHNRQEPTQARLFFTDDIFLDNTPPIEKNEQNVFVFNLGELSLVTDQQYNLKVQLFTQADVDRINDDREAFTSKINCGTFTYLSAYNINDFKLSLSTTNENGFNLFDEDDSNNISSATFKVSTNETRIGGELAFNFYIEGKTANDSPTLIATLSDNYDFYENEIILESDNFREAAKDSIGSLAGISNSAPYQKLQVSIVFIDKLKVKTESSSTGLEIILKVKADPQWNQEEIYASLLNNSEQNLDDSKWKELKTKYFNSSYKIENSQYKISKSEKPYFICDSTLINNLNDPSINDKYQLYFKIKDTTNFANDQIPLPNEEEGSIIGSITEKTQTFSIIPFYRYTIEKENGTTDIIDIKGIPKDLTFIRVYSVYLEMFSETANNNFSLINNGNNVKLNFSKIGGLDNYNDEQAKGETNLWRGGNEASLNDEYFTIEYYIEKDTGEETGYLDFVKQNKTEALSETMALSDGGIIKHPVSLLKENYDYLLNVNEIPNGNYTIKITIHSFGFEISKQIETFTLQKSNPLLGFRNNGLIINGTFQESLQDPTQNDFIRAYIPKDLRISLNFVDDERSESGTIKGSVYVGKNGKIKLDGFDISSNRFSTLDNFVWTFNKEVKKEDNTVEIQELGNISMTFDEETEQIRFGSEIMVEKDYVSDGWSFFINDNGSADYEIVGASLIKEEEEEQEEFDSKILGYTSLKYDEDFYGGELSNNRLILKQFYLDLESYLGEEPKETLDYIKSLGFEDFKKYFGIYSIKENTDDDFNFQVAIPLEFLYYYCELLEAKVLDLESRIAALELPTTSLTE